MQYILLLLLISFTAIPMSFAEDAPPSEAIYSNDGAHWYTLTSENNTYTLVVDGGKKNIYGSIESPTYYKNILYSVATDERGTTKYILKNGDQVFQGQVAALLQDFNNYTRNNSTILSGWYGVNNGAYTLKNADGKIVLEDTNAGSSSYSILLGSGVIESIIYDRNNQNPRFYLNEKKISDSFSYAIGARKVKNGFEIFYTNLNAEGITEILLYNTITKKSRKLPSYDGVQTYSVTTNKDTFIKNLNYIVLIGEKYSIIDMNGKIINNESFDELPSVTTYGDKFLIRYAKNQKKYFSFNGITYGPYDELDESFNTSYGFHPMKFDSIDKWSIFAQKNSKNYIVVNGKELAY